jgi:hypothetical protein
MWCDVRPTQKACLPQAGVEFIFISCNIFYRNGKEGFAKGAKNIKVRNLLNTEVKYKRE